MTEISYGLLNSYLYVLPIYGLLLLLVRMQYPLVLWHTWKCFAPQEELFLTVHPHNRVFVPTPEESATFDAYLKDLIGEQSQANPLDTTITTTQSPTPSVRANTPWRYEYAMAGHRYELKP